MKHQVNISIEYGGDVKAALTLMANTSCNVFPFLISAVIDAALSVSPFHSSVRKTLDMALARRNGEWGDGERRLVTVCEGCRIWVW